MNRLIKNSLTICILSYMIVGCTKKQEAVVHPTLDQFIASNASISMFGQAIEKANLGDYKNGPGPFTFVAPSNDAFVAAGITSDSMNKMSSGAANYLIMYHILNSTTNPPSRVLTSDMIAPASVSRTTQIGGSLAYIGTKDGKFYINGGEITSGDNFISNGVVHILNKVNTPPNLNNNMQSILSRTGQHSLFIALLTRGGQWAQLTGGVFTVLAPTDAAMMAAGAPFNSLTNINAMTVADASRFSRYHMFSSARLFSNDFKNGFTPSTLQGPGRTIAVSGNGAKLKGPQNPTEIDFGTIRNVLGINGVLHSLAGVLRPNP